MKSLRHLNSTLNQSLSRTRAKTRALNKLFGVQRPEYIKQAYDDINAGTIDHEFNKPLLVESVAELEMLDVSHESVRLSIQITDRPILPRMASKTILWNDDQS